MITMSTIAVSNKTLSELMKLKAERVRKGNMTTYDEIISELLEAQATDELPIKETDLQKTIVLIKQKLAAGSIKRKDLTKVSLMQQGFLEKDAEEILEVVTG